MSHHRRPSVQEDWLYSWKGDSRCLCVLVVSVDRDSKSTAQRRQTLWSACLLKVLWNFLPWYLGFPSRLIKEEIALEEATMTKGLLIIQRPLYQAHIQHEKHSQCVDIKLWWTLNRGTYAPGRDHGNFLRKACLITQKRENNHFNKNKSIISWTCS